MAISAFLVYYVECSYLLYNHLWILSPAQLVFDRIACTVGRQPNVIRSAGRFAPVPFCLAVLAFGKENQSIHALMRRRGASRGGVRPTAATTSGMGVGTTLEWASFRLGVRFG